MPVEKGFCLVALPGSTQLMTYNPNGKEPLRLDFVPFDADKQLAIQIDLSVEANVHFLSPANLKERPDEPVSNKEDYLHAVNKAVRSFVPGGFSKVVLARNEVVPLPVEFNPVGFFNRICTAYPHAFRYLLWHPEAGMWIGASPELLLEVNRGALRTMALAGTLSSPDKNWTDKELQEHDIVSRYITDQLMDVPVTNLQVNKPTTVKAGNLQHLRTDIYASIDSGSIDRVLAKLHPTPAVAGFPAAEALGFLSKFEHLNRSYYAGYVGLRGQDSAQLFVNLRCMRVYRNAIEFFAGAGITSGSDAISEWEETERKIATLKDRLFY